MMATPIVSETFFKNKIEIFKNEFILKRFWNTLLRYIFQRANFNFHIDNKNIFLFIVFEIVSKAESIP